MKSLTGHAYKFYGSTRTILIRRTKGTTAMISDGDGKKLELPVKAVRHAIKKGALVEIKPTWALLQWR